MKKNSMQLSQDLRDKVADIAAFDPEEIQGTDLIYRDLGMDSIMMMDLLVSLTADYPDLKKISPSDPRWHEDISYSMLEEAFYEILGFSAPLVSAAVNYPTIDSMEQVVRFQKEISEQTLETFFPEHEGVAGATININGRKFINYSSYNYLNTNGSDRITQAVTDAITKYGTSVSAARIIGGEIPLHRNLEQEISDFLGVEDSIVQVGGHSTNVNIISHLFGPGDLILHDSLAHNSIIQGAVSSGAQRKSFQHNNAASLESELKRVRNRFNNVLVIVEGVYSMDGDIANLNDIVNIKEQYGSFLMIDEAHSLGTIGDGGRGICSQAEIDPQRVDILMGTLSKSLNSCGGYIAGRENFIKYLKFQLPGFMFSVGLSPSNTAAALESLRILKENPSWVSDLNNVASKFRQKMQNLGLDTGLSNGTPIIPWIIGDSQKAVSIATQLMERGIYVAPITYPAVPEKEARLRFFISRGHTEKMVEETLSVIKETIEG